MIIEEATIDSLEASRLIGELSDTLCRLTGSSGKSSFNMSDMQSPRAIFVIAREENVAVGCGALREGKIAMREGIILWIRKYKSI